MEDEEIGHSIGIIEGSLENDNRVKKAIGAKIQEARITAGFSRRQVEQMCSLEPGSLVEFECGSLRPDPIQMARIAILLERPTFYFVAELLQDSATT
jgi:transcriptional regulator with XRE-family HTH domain